MRAPFAPRVERAFLGKYRPKIDGRDKARGAALYADDLANARVFPGLLFAKVLRSPYPHARILGLDSSEAERLPGVRAILRYNDRMSRRSRRPTPDGPTGSTRSAIAR